MYSKTIELTGLGVIAAAVALMLGVAAGLVVGGLALLLVGATTDDAQVGPALARGWNRARFIWFRQLVRENGLPEPELGMLAPTEVPCECVRGGEPKEDCPVCYGAGRVPNPALRVGVGPHPPIVGDALLDKAARRLAARRRERGDGRIREGAR